MNSEEAAALLKSLSTARAEYKRATGGSASVPMLINWLKEHSKPTLKERVGQAYVGFALRESNGCMVIAGTVQLRPSKVVFARMLKPIYRPINSMLGRAKGLPLIGYDIHVEASGESPYAAVTLVFKE